MLSQTSSDTVDVVGVPFRATTLPEAMNWLIEQAMRVRRGEPVPVAVRLMNSYCVALADADPAYRDLVTSGDGVNFPDGAPVAWMIRRLGSPEGRQVRGPSLFAQTLERGRAAGLRHYLFGSTPDTIQRLTAALEGRYEGLRIAGADAGQFGDVEEILTTDAVNTIRAARPEIVWVGMGTPKQDFVAARLTELLEVPCVGVGAAFDFAAGTVREAPAVLSRMGLEWVFRLVAEPRRLWRRYLWGNSKFIQMSIQRLLARERRAP